jgi:hypothetical protein
MREHQPAPPAAGPQAQGAALARFVLLWTHAAVNADASWWVEPGWRDLRALAVARPQVPLRTLRRLGAALEPPALPGLESLIRGLRRTGGAQASVAPPSPILEFWLGETAERLAVACRHLGAALWSPVLRRTILRRELPPWARERRADDGVAAMLGRAATADASICSADADAALAAVRQAFATAMEPAAEVLHASGATALLGSVSELAPDRDAQGAAWRRCLYRLPRHMAGRVPRDCARDDAGRAALAAWCAHQFGMPVEPTP